MSPFQKKRIAIFVNYYLPYRSGLTECVSQFAQGLAQAGYDVTVYCWRHNAQVGATDEIAGVKIRRFKGLIKFDKGIISFSYMWAALTESRKFDLVIPVLPMAESFLFRLGAGARKLLPLYVCDIKLAASPLSRIVETISYLSMEYLLSASRRIVGLSIDYARSSRLLGKRVEHVFPVTPPIRISERTETPGDAFNKHYGLDPASPKIGFAGRIVAEKGLDVLLKAVALDADYFRGKTIVIAGEYENVAGGSLKSEMEKLIPAGANVRFIGFVPDELMNSFYGSLDVFVLPSTMSLEAYGIVQVEAMLCGTPVVASDLPGVREIIMRTGCGLIAKRADPADLLAKIKEVLASRQKFQPVRADVCAKLRLEDSNKMFTDIVGISLTEGGRA